MSAETKPFTIAAGRALGALAVARRGVGAPEAGEVRARVLGEAIAASLSLLACTWRVVRLPDDRADGVLGDSARPAGERRLFVFCHGDAVLAAGTHLRLAPATLASWHRDGEMVAHALRRLGFPVVRGSTRRGGARAMFALARLAREGRDLAVTPDGPLGPSGSVGRGIVELARRARLAIVPVGFGASRSVALRTWDRCRIAPPGARVVVVYGEALSAPQAGDAGAAETARREVARRLLAVRESAMCAARGSA
jgi:lysophospholipid acyltransferase (LPLAT)-like uncharacterized protein